MRTSGHLEQGGMSQLMGDGSVLTYTPDGGAVLNARGAHSDLPGANLNFTQGIQRSASREAATLESSGTDKQIRASESAHSAFATAMTHDWSRGQSTGSIDSFRTSEQTAFSKEAAKLHDHAVNWSKQTGHSLSDSSQILAAATLSTSGFGGFLAKLGGLSFEGKFTGQTVGEQKELYEKAAKYAETHHLRDSYSISYSKRVKMAVMRHRIERAVMFTTVSVLILQSTTSSASKPLPISARPGA